VLLRMGAIAPETCRAKIERNKEYKEYKKYI
jgi:hypothetical protein